MIHRRPYYAILSAFVGANRHYLTLGHHTISHVQPSDIPRSYGGNSPSYVCLDELMNDAAMKIYDTSSRVGDLYTLLAESSLLAESPPTNLGHSTKKGRNKKQIARNRKRNKNKKTHKSK